MKDVMRFERLNLKHTSIVSQRGRPRVKGQFWVLWRFGDQLCRRWEL